MNTSFQQRLAATGLIGIFRGVRPDEVEQVIGAAIEGGLKIVEIPMNSPQPLKSVGILAHRFGQDIIIGAGTVTTVEQVQQVADAGGRLIVTPYARAEVVRKAKAMGLVAVPGALTPTEIAAMSDQGADAVKIFPAEMVLPSTLKGLKAVLPEFMPLIPVGGIDLSNMKGYLAAGAAGFGLGSALYRAGDNSAEVRIKAKTFMAHIEELKARRE